MKKKINSRKLTLNRETLIHLAGDDLGKAAGAATLTLEGSCDECSSPCTATVDGRGR